MDPFSSVLEDAERQLNAAEIQLNQYRLDRSAGTLADLHNTIEDLTEVVKDLAESIQAVQARPSDFGLQASEVEQRITLVGRINNRVNDIQQALASFKHASQAAQAPTPYSDQSFAALPPDEATSPLPGVSEEDREMLFQDTIREQDTILGEVETTVTALREQANIMSRELEDQAEIIDDFESQVDSSGDRLSRAKRRVDWVLRHNRDTMSNCCILLLIVALIILLVLVIVT